MKIVSPWSLSVCLYTNACAREAHAQADGHEGANTDRKTDGRAERQADTQADQRTSKQAKIQSRNLRHEHALQTKARGGHAYFTCLIHFQQ